MGLFSVNGERLDVIQDQIWYPNLMSKSEWTRVFSQPDFKQLYDHAIETTDSIVEVFQLNKAVKGHYGKVAGERPGLATRLADASYEVHVPVSRRVLDIASMAVHNVVLPAEATDPTVHGPHAGRVAIALAVQAHVTQPYEH